MKRPSIATTSSCCCRSLFHSAAVESVQGSAFIRSNACKCKHTHTHAHSRSKRRGESGWWRCVFSAGTRIITTPPPALFPFPPRSAAFLIVFEHRGSRASVILKTERDACANFLINAVVSEVPVNRCCCTVIHISMVVQRSSQRKTFTDLVLFT